MPIIEPSGGEVNWSKNEGTLGVVGVAPWATIDFCKALYRKIGATKDWHYPRVLVDINTKLPSRGRHLDLGEPDPSPAIAETIEELYMQGATVVVVPCNTAHILYERWAKDAPVPIPHIVRETLSMAKHAGVNKFTPLTSTSLSIYDLYGKLAEEFNLQCHRLRIDEQEMVSKMIEDVKMYGIITKANLIKFNDLTIELRKHDVDAIVIGCTELSSLVRQFKMDNLKAFDSNDALSLAALKALNMPYHLIASDGLY